MYSKITNPITGRKISINGKLGKTILINYLLVLKGQARLFLRPQENFHATATCTHSGIIYHKFDNGKFIIFYVIYTNVINVG